MRFKLLKKYVAIAMIVFILAFSNVVLFGAVIKVNPAKKNTLSGSQSLTLGTQKTTTPRVKRVRRTPTRVVAQPMMPVRMTMAS